MSTTAKLRPTFGRIAIDKGYVRPQALTEVLQQQKRMADRDVLARLGELMLLVGQLNVEQLFDVLGEQVKTVRVCRHCERTFRVAVPSGNKKRPRCPECGERMENGRAPSLTDVKTDMTRLKRRLSQVDRRELRRIKLEQECFRRPSNTPLRLSAAQSQARSAGGYKPAAAKQKVKRLERRPKMANLPKKRPVRKPSTRFSLKQVQAHRGQRRGTIPSPVLVEAEGSGRWKLLVGMLLLPAIVACLWSYRSASPSAGPPVAAVARPAPGPAVDVHAWVVGRLVLIEEELALDTGSKRVWLAGEQPEAFAHMRRFIRSGQKTVYLQVWGTLISEQGELVIQVAQWQRTPAQQARLVIEERSSR